MQNYEIIRGVKPAPPRIILYGLEGIGKSTFAAGLPSPIFVQTEDGLNNIDCARFPLPVNFDDVIRQLCEVNNYGDEFKTVVIDSLDWLERIIWDAVSSENKVDNIEKIGFGKGYVMALTYWKKVLAALDILRKNNKIICLLAHAVAEDYSDPEVQGIKRFTPRLHKGARSLLTEWADCVLLATREHGAALGEVDNPRILRTTPMPYQFAKTRYPLPETLPLNPLQLLSLIKESQKIGEN